MKFRILLLILVLLSTSVLGEEGPRLVVNIVVNSTRHETLARFSQNFNDEGFNIFLQQGVCFEESYYNFMQTSTPATLATLTTGTDPSTHGIVGEQWWDFTSGKPVGVIEDAKAHTFGANPKECRVSNQHIVTPTLGDKLLESSPKSKVITIATDAISAIVMGGMDSKEVYWIDPLRGKWTTSTKYKTTLPNWVKKYNNEGYGHSSISQDWFLKHSRNKYVNSKASVAKSRISGRIKPNKIQAKDIPKLVVTPTGNKMVANFAKEAMIYNKLGQDDNVDLLNICFDTPGYIAQKYGIESVEMEDMYYHLDETLASLIRFIEAQCRDNSVLFVLTSDHGTSDFCDANNDERFNVRQFKMLAGSFLSATYGGTDWVLGYSNRQLFLNRQQIFSKGLNLEDVQRQVASFALQFRGVSHVLIASDLTRGVSGEGYASKMNNSFYPKRSGDLILNLMPGWIEQTDEEDKTKSKSGSMYDYDTHVPLIFYGCGLPADKIYDEVDMNSVAVTLARVMGIPRPVASIAKPIQKILNYLGRYRLE